MQTSQSTFKYHELEGSAREKARQHYIENWVGDDWYDYIYEDAKEGGAIKGFDIQNINFSGFWSQGDGAMWTGEVNLPEFITHYLPESIGRECWLWLVQDGWVDDRVGVYRSGHHYSHSNCMGVANSTTVGNSEDDTLRIECILTNAPIDTLWNLIVADPNCPIKDVSDLEELITERARAYADMIYDRLRDGYEYECSEGQISECYDANEVLFNEEGEQV